MKHLSKVLTSKVWSPRNAATTLAIVMAAAGLAALSLFFAGRETPPRAPAAASAGQVAPSSPASTPTSTAARARGTRRTTTTIGLPPSAPIAISVPSIGVESSIVDLGRNADGSVEVPTSFHVVGWYKYAVTPGQVGPSVFLGHVDSTSGPGIFYRLGQLHIGDRVIVKRGDGRSVTYAISGVRKYSKAAFPSIDVYGNTSVPTIRLVTCGGTFDPVTRHYLFNIVAFGEEV